MPSRHNLGILPPFPRLAAKRQIVHTYTREVPQTLIVDAVDAAIGVNTLTREFHKDKRLWPQRTTERWRASGLLSLPLQRAFLLPLSRCLGYFLLRYNLSYAYPQSTFPAARRAG